MKKTVSTLVAFFMLVAVFWPIRAVADARTGPGPDSGAGLALASHQDLDKFLDEFLPPAMTRLHVPGVVFVAVKDGEVLTMRGFGYSDIESGKEVDPLRTVFRAGSVSKVFTGMAVMQLVEGGLLDLDEDVNTYIEGFKIPDTYPQPITLRHLLTHTAGFDERYLGVSEFGQDVYPELGEYLALELPPRIRPPGQVIQYSNHGMALAGYVVECVSGIPFARYIEKNILTPLGMDHSSFELTSKVETLLSSSYKWRKSKYEKVPYIHTNVVPAGMLMTCGADMAKFIMANLAGGELAGERVLCAEYVDAMQSQQFTNHPLVPGMGYSWMIGRRNGRRTVFHGGDIPQFSTQLVLVPDEDFGVFMSGNGIGAATLNDELTKELFDTFFPGPKAEETVHFGEGPDVSVPSLPAGDPQDLAGAYRMIRDPMTTAEKAISLLTQIRVTAQGDEAVALVFPIGSGMPHTIWVAERPGVYRDTASGALMVFDEWQTLFGRNRPSRMYIDLWAFDRLKFYETTSFATVCLGIIIAVFVWPVLAWVFRRKASGLAVLLGLVDVVAVTGIAGSLLTAPDWEITTRVPNTTKAALALPLVGTALAVALAWQTLTKTVDSKKPCRRPFNLRTRQGFASRVLPWLCVVAHAGLVWFLNIWNLLGWKF